MAITPPSLPSTPSTPVDFDTTTKEVIRRGIAGSVYEDILDPDRGYFIVLGRSFPWTPGMPGVYLGGETVPYPTDDVDTYNRSNRNAFFAKRIGVNDVRLMLPLIPWKKGTRYARYSSNVNIFDENYIFFVCTSDGSVYKCLENGRNTEQIGVPSLIEPSVKDTKNSFSTGDGYRWKYMFTVPDYEKRLITAFTDETNYIPVSRPSGNYTFGEQILQFEVQENAVPGTVDSVFINPLTGITTGTGGNYLVSSAKNRNYKIISGVSGATSMKIGSPSLVSASTNAYQNFTITITSGPGAGISRKINSYTYAADGGVVTFTQPLPRAVPVDSNYQIAPTITILGDGTGAEGYLKLTEYPNTFGLEKYVVTNTGRDYTSSFLSDPLPAGTLTNFVGHVNVAPPGGHGYDAVRELNPTYVQICVDINGGETASTLNLADGEFRQVMIMKDPILWNQSKIAGTENSRFTEVVLRTTAATADIEPIAFGNYIFGETSRSVGQIENVRNTGRDWILLVKNLNGRLIPTVSGSNGENISIYSHTAIGSEFKRLSKDAAFVVSYAPYLASNATNQAYKLTTTIGVSGGVFTPTLSSFKSGYAYIGGLSADKFNSRIFSVRTAAGPTASHIVELTGVVGIENLVAAAATGAFLSFDRITATGSVVSQQGVGQIVSFSPPAFEPLSGEIIYIENTEAKTRDRLQTERISVLIKI